MRVAYFSLEFGLARLPPALLGRPRHPRRRSPEVGLRPGRAAGRRRPALPQRVLPPVPRPPTAAARALPDQRLVRPAARRPARPRRRAGRRRGRDRRRARCAPRVLAHPGRARAALPARHQPRGQLAERPRASPTSSTAATATCASARRSCSASAASARCARSGIAPTVFHMNEGHSAFLALERIRVLIEDGGIDVRRGARAGDGLHRLHHPHAGPGRQRHLRAGAGARTYLEPLADGAGSTGRSSLALAAQPGRRDGLVRHDAARDPHLAGFVNGVARAARRDLAPHVARRSGRDLPVERGADRQHHQRHPPAELAQPRDARAARPLPRPGPARAPGGPDRLGARRRDPRRGAVARARAAPRAAGAVRARAPARASWARQGSRRARQPGRRRRAATPTRSRSASRAASPPTSAATLLFRDPERLAPAARRREPPGADRSSPARPTRPTGRARMLRQRGAATRAPALRGRIVFLEDYDMHVAPLPRAGRRRLAQHRRAARSRPPAPAA